MQEDSIISCWKVRTDKQCINCEIRGKGTTKFEWAPENLCRPPQLCPKNFTKCVEYQAFRLPWHNGWLFCLLFHCIVIIFMWGKGKLCTAAGVRELHTVQLHLHQQLAQLLLRMSWSYGMFLADDGYSRLGNFGSSPIQSMFWMYLPDDTKSMVQEAGSLRRYGQGMGLKVVKSCSWGHFPFTCSDNFAIGCNI